MLSKLVFLVCSMIASSIALGAVYSSDFYITNNTCADKGYNCPELSVTGSPKCWRTTPTYAWLNPGEAQKYVGDGPLCSEGTTFKVGITSTEGGAWWSCMEPELRDDHSLVVTTELKSGVNPQMATAQDYLIYCSITKKGGVLRYWKATYCGTTLCE